jgi:hypothetical protein
VNVDISDRHLKHFITHTHNFRLDSVDVEEGSPYKTDKFISYGNSRKPE